MKNYKLLGDKEVGIERIEIVGNSIFIIYDDDSFLEINKTSENYDYITNFIFKKQIIDNLIKYKLGNKQDKICRMIKLLKYFLRLSAVSVVAIIISLFNPEISLLLMTIYFGAEATRSVLDMIKDFKESKVEKEFKKDIDKFLYYLENEVKLKNSMEAIQTSENSDILLSTLELSAAEVMSKISILKEEGVIDSPQIDTNVVDQITKEDLMEYQRVLLSMKQVPEEDSIKPVIIVSEQIIPEKPVIIIRE